jgi:CHAD domain-containing protein
VPPGPLCDELNSAAGIRRLFPLVEVELRTQALSILDSEEKTVARAVIERIGATKPGATRKRSSSAPAVLRILPVKGFVEEHREALLFLKGLGLERRDGTPLDLALAAIRRQPLDYSSKIDLRFDPSCPAGDAVRTVLRRLLQTMRANEEGVRNDLDPEFLHDFRVACRRTRSCLRQLRSVLPARDVERFSRELKWLGGITGPMRDLDVYVLKLDEYRSDIPDQRDDLQPLEEFLLGRRASELRRLVRAMDSTRFAGLLSDWSAFLDQEHGAGGNGARPIVDVAPSRIERLHGRVLKKGRKLGRSSPIEKFHRIRIECKKLRYLLEFFRSLYEPGVIEPLLRELKRLQDNLGDLNDLQVHQTALAGFADEMMRNKLATAGCLLAMGRLVERLGIRQNREREAFAALFTSFAGREGLTGSSKR